MKQITGALLRWVSENSDWKKNSYARILYGIRLVFWENSWLFSKRLLLHPTPTWRGMKSYHIYQHIRHITHREMGNFLRIIFWKKNCFHTQSRSVSKSCPVYRKPCYSYKNNIWTLKWDDTFHFRSLQVDHSQGRADFVFVVWDVSALILWSVNPPVRQSMWAVQINNAKYLCWAKFRFSPVSRITMCHG